MRDYVTEAFEILALYFFEDREFFRAFAHLTKMASLHPSSLAPRALVVGAGPMADFIHLPILAELRDRGALDLAVICDLDPQRAKAAREKFGIAEAMGDAAQAIVRADIDLVYLFASAQVHADYGRMALEAGKHLFVEKPIAPSSAEASALAELAARRGLIAAGGHNRRFHPGLGALRGKAGWRSADIVFHKPMTGKPPAFGARSWLSANGIHALDALLDQMGGLPDEIGSVSDGSHVFSAVMRWPGGAQAGFLCNNRAGARQESYSFHAPGLSRSLTEDESPPRDSFIAEHEAFLDSVRSGSPPRHALSALAPSLFLAELIEDGYSGRVVQPLTAPVPEPTRNRPSILVVEPARWGVALAALEADYRLISPEAVSGTRTDVVAALLGRGAAPLPASLLDRLPNLAVAGIHGLSVARLEPQDLTARGVALINASDAHAESVAEFALGLAIMARRRAFPGHESMRDGGWGTSLVPRWRATAKKLKPFLERMGLGSAITAAKRRLPPPVPATPRDLAGAVVGLIGWGTNAQAFARRLQASGAEVLVWSDHAPPELAAPLDRVLAADIVSLHRGLTPKTRHTLGADELARLRPGAVLINIARGALIDPEALVARLSRGDVFACLDTFDQEPLPARHPLRRLPNVFLTPHIAGGSPDMQQQAAAEVVNKVMRYLAGDRAIALKPERLGGMT